MDPKFEEKRRRKNIKGTVKVHERPVHLLQNNQVVVIKPSFLMILDLYSPFSSYNVCPY